MQIDLRGRLCPLRIAGLAALLMLSQAVGALDGQQPAPEKPFVERVEVVVHQVFIVATSSKGAPVSTLQPSDLEILEDGTPAEVLGIEPVRSLTPPTLSAEETATGTSPTSQKGVPQVLYLDTSVINRRSVPLISKAVDSNVKAILRNGPLEVVVADPEPRTVVPSTRDAETLQRAIDRLPKAASGKEALLLLRHDTVRLINDVRGGAGRPTSSKASSIRSALRAAVREETSIIQDSLGRLQMWASTLPGNHASVLYLANDGFDLDPTEVYREAVFGDDETVLAVQELAQEFGGVVPRMIAETSAMLAGRGISAVVLALGSTSAEFAGSAANLDKRGGAAIRRPVDSGPLFYYARPFDPIRIVAAETGGEFVSSASKFDDAVDRLGGAFLVSFRTAGMPKAGRTSLEIRSRRADLVVRGPRVSMTGTPAGVALARAVRSLTVRPEAGALPTTASVEGVARGNNGLLSGRLFVRVDLTALAAALDRIGSPHMRVSLAVEVEGARPFTRQDEVDVKRSGSGGLWIYETPMTWPQQARRVAIGVEEIRTDTSGAAVISLPTLNVVRP